MYESFFGLHRKPFSALPDPDFLVDGGEHARALSLLEYGIREEAGFCVVTGEVGSGKSTLIHALLNRLGKEITVGIIPNTHRSFRLLARWALMAFDQKPRSDSPAELYQELMLFLIAEFSQGRRCLLIVDEAQNLTVEALEELRVLSNINSGSDMLLQLVLVGQAGLLETLKDPALAQLAQRITVSHGLRPLTCGEVGHYVRRRLELGGASARVFTSRALAGIYLFSGGIPRQINALCDLALVYAFADLRRRIDLETILRVATDRRDSGFCQFANLGMIDSPSLAAEIETLIGALGEDPPEDEGEFPFPIMGDSSAAEVAPAALSHPSPGIDGSWSVVVQADVRNEDWDRAWEDSGPQPDRLIAAPTEAPAGPASWPIAHRRFRTPTPQATSGRMGRSRGSMASLRRQFLPRD